MGSNRGLGLFHCIEWRRAVGNNARPYWMHRCQGILTFSSALEADLISPVFDCEHATHPSVMAPERRLQDPEQRFHTSWVRLRSQLPFASSQFRRERTLARASAIEQSAAP